jgi:maltose O-acetyltransferase
VNNKMGTMVRHLLLTLQSFRGMPWFVRVRLIRLSGISVGKSTKIEHEFSAPDCQLSIGERTYINAQLLVEGSGTVRIGANVRIAPRVSLLTGTHSITDDPLSRASAQVSFLPVTIEDGCWICANVTIQPGVTVRSGCVVASGAVVTRDTEPNGLYVGVPALRKSDLPCRQMA